MDERILVCVYYGPNGERLIRRGCEIANMLKCPLYILTIDPLPEDELDIEKSRYIESWKQLAEENNAEQFIIKYNESRPVAKVIAEVSRQKHITQIVIGQTAKSRWQEITKSSLINALLHEIPFVDLHIVSVARELKNREGFFEKGIRAYLVAEGDGYRLSFNYSPEVVHEGLFFKEVGTDFNNGIFKYMHDNHMVEVQVIDSIVNENISG